MTDNRWRHFALHTVKTSIETFRQVNKHRTTEQVIDWMKGVFETLNGHCKDLRIYVDGMEYGMDLYDRLEKQYLEHLKRTEEKDEGSA